MHIILTGATGTVGHPVLRHCLASSKVTQLSILSRKQFDLPVDDRLDIKKARVIVHDDYTDYPESLLKTLHGAQGCVWAQGISQTEVSKDDYLRITHDYPLAAAKSFATLAPEAGHFNFVYVSGEGADPTEKTFTMFGKIKGRTEKELLALPASAPAYAPLRSYNVRPGYVDPELRYRPLSVTKRTLEFVIAPILRTLLPSQVSPTAILSKTLVDLATGDGGPIVPKEGQSGIEAEGRTVRSAAIRWLGV
ncbi:MAG: hypothetical protein M4579_006314 [Chaenotheca gracillima]|nr:MAG: hypothetical protein M4579_006314 [Chaenotheca gracillima]